ncbi:uncharacterized protein BDZ83DRAFT_616945 [Colletotrichum acutatum]|uniref:Uncharacterized protein n=1 Tax=Glomerella acutata TaxID=27357 RepID=A0AAD8UMT1_GLOAC|nr:uncharacterized protein BDZ83DRAFT_616945 [Colletotrichum acutatum]KAK1726258.1 hypothetical protein BDZ83DRAFT_616945 [Colletotrichum acutatum]
MLRVLLPALMYPARAFSLKAKYERFHSHHGLMNVVKVEKMLVSVWCFPDVPPPNISIQLHASFASTRKGNRTSFKCNSPGCWPFPSSRGEKKRKAAKITQ